LHGDGSHHFGKSLMFPAGPQDEASERLLQRVADSALEPSRTGSKSAAAARGKA
jgi:hypothetical protein